MNCHYPWKNSYVTPYSLIDLSRLDHYPLITLFYNFSFNPIKTAIPAKTHPPLNTPVFYFSQSSCSGDDTLHSRYAHCKERQNKMKSLI